MKIDPMRKPTKPLDVSKHTEFLRRWFAANPHATRILIMAPLTHGRVKSRYLVSEPARHGMSLNAPREQRRK